MSFAIISNTIKMQPHHLKHSLQIVLESSLEEKPRAESAHFYNIFEGYDNLLVDLLRDIGDFRDNDYIEFDLYLSYYALLLRKFLLETIFTKNQEVTVAGYGLGTTFPVPRNRLRFFKFGLPGQPLISRDRLALQFSRFFSLFPC